MFRVMAVCDGADSFKGHNYIAHFTSENTGRYKEQKMKIIVTGAAGQLGSDVIKEAEKTIQIYDVNKITKYFLNGREQLDKKETIHIHNKKITKEIIVETTKK